MYDRLLFSDIFTRAPLYPGRQAPAGSVREIPPSARYFPHTERHLRCIWADPALRPPVLISNDGQTVTVESPGRWNLEAGPDFIDAVLRIDPGARRVRGDVEIHIRPADWDAHQHSGDPRYGRLVAHVTYFPGAPQPDLPPGTLHLALRDNLRNCPAFSFEAIDLTAYPYGERSPHPPCSDAMRRLPPEAREVILDAAGEERLRRKSERLAGALRETTPHQALYAETFAALGYKHNRAPFGLLAARLPLDRLREAANGRPCDAYALLCGVAGLLPAKTSPAWDRETRDFVRNLWDFWWKVQKEYEPLMLSRGDWVLANLRPQNHPLRRLMAAAHLFCGEPALDKVLAEIDTAQPGAALSDIASLIGRAGMGTYWARRHALTAERQEKPVALIGAGRTAAIMINAVVPWLAACGRFAGETQALLQALPPEDDNRIVRHTAHALFGHDHNPALYRSGLRQQGLIQIFNDFCLNSRAECRTCAFPSLIETAAIPDAQSAAHTVP